MSDQYRKVEGTFANNAEKINFIKTAYPRAYAVLEKFFPGLIQWPDDMPQAHVMSANEMVRPYFSLGEAQMLQFY